MNCLQIVVSCYGVTTLNGNVKIQEKIQMMKTETNKEEKKDDKRGTYAENYIPA